MKIIAIFTKEVYEVSVETNKTNEPYSINIDGTTLHITKDEWHQIKTFIDKSIDFFEKNSKKICIYQKKVVYLHRSFLH